MDLKDDFYMAVEAVIAINFNNPDFVTMTTISVFETNIRYLGGILSAFELSGCYDQRLLEKAVELGDMLLLAFDTPTGIPINGTQNLHLTS